MFRRRGFTLVELIIVIVLVGILTAVVGPLIGGRYQAVSDAQQRARWVQQAEFAFFHLRQDLNRSIPNSVRTPVAGDDAVVEFLSLDSDQDVNALRYRDRPYNPDFDRLQVNNDDSFDVFDAISAGLPLYVSVGGTSATQILGDWEAERGGADEGVIAELDTGPTPNAAGSCDCGDCGQCPVTNLELDNNNHRFGDDSPHYRAYLTNGPLAYQCSGGRLIRHSGHMDASNTDISTRSAGFSRVADAVVDCQFEWIPGLTNRPPSLVVALTLGNADESVRLVETILLSNAP